MKRDKYRLKEGFTLIEIVVIVAIIAIVTAVAVPAVAGYFNLGKSKNRQDIARTLYLAAQNQLTELRITKNLKKELTSGYYSYNSTTGEYTEIAYELDNTDNVSKELGGLFTDIDENKPYVHYISKEKGNTDPTHPVMMLLDPVILDKEILNDAILIEYNIETGVVYSVFYSDEIDGALGYMGDESDSEPGNVYGRRGMGSGGYGRESARKQGYYGVGETGSINETALPTATINIYDSCSYSQRLPDDAAHENKNVLYADILLPADVAAGNTFNLLIDGAVVHSGETFSGAMQTDLSGAVGSIPGSSPLIYKYDDGNDETVRIIWVLDYVGGDMADPSGNMKHSIGVKYGAEIGDGKSNIRVGIEGGGLSETSFAHKHPYFNSQNSYGSDGDTFEIYSARHLYNIRYFNNGSFTQKEDIDLEESGVTNFAPITNFASITGFEGTYKGIERTDSPDNGFVIKNLTIDLTSSSLPSNNNAGLFGTIESGASVIGLTLENPSVKGNDKVGSVCGILKGEEAGNPKALLSGIYVRYNDDSKAIEGNSNVGGIVGENNGVLTDSTFISSTAEEHVKGTAAADKTTIGGIVGTNGSTAALKRILFLAIAPKDGVGASAISSPIVGKNSAADDSLGELYYLSGTPRRPTMAGSDYNKVTLNGTGKAFGEGMGTWELYEKLYDELSNSTGILKDGNWMKNMRADGTPLTETEAVSESSIIYPYPYSKYSMAQAVTTSVWPIVDVYELAYYERYEDGSYGLWFIGDGSDDGFLDSRKVIHEAGYVIIWNHDLSEDNYFFARSVKVDGDLEDDWAAADRVGGKIILETGDTSDVAKAIAEVRSMSGASVSADNVWAFILPLDKISAKADDSIPLQIMYSLDDDGENPSQINELIQPLFAKGLYSYGDHLPDPEEFYIRTPWQMRNISVLTAATATSGYTKTKSKIFTQERDLNFGSTGIGVHTAQTEPSVPPWSALSKSVVTGVFEGEYNGNLKIISDVQINAPGIAAVGLFEDNANGGKIKNVTLMDSNINGYDYVGAIAGINRSIIQTTGVAYSTVKGNVPVGGITHVGGIAGHNQSTIEDVFFLSIKEVDDSPVSDDIGGGIVGYNDIGNGKVRRALYLAPAPKQVDGSQTTIYPIVRNGDEAYTESGKDTCFYLSGSRYSLDKGATWEKDAADANIPYNRVTGTDVIRKGGGTGIVSKFFRATNLNMLHGVTLANWFQPVSSYPYPVIKAVIDSNEMRMLLPAEWPITDSPDRTDQLDRPDNGPAWAAVESNDGRALNLNFINGDFELPLMNPDVSSETHGIISATPNEFDCTREQADWNPCRYGNGKCQNVKENTYCWYNEKNPPTIRYGETWHGMFAYYHHDWVQGWKTRPVSGNYTNTLWNAIELQRPASDGSWGRTRTDYKGNTNGIYAELNAEVEGTLYQICPTEPGSAMYYSFYHAKRGNDNFGWVNSTEEKMNFYLSGMVSQAGAVGTWTYADGTGKPTIIRPCWTPRGNGPSSSGSNTYSASMSSTATRNSVVYGNTGENSGKVSFYDPALVTGGTRTAHLYDVWVGGDDGYGITFWYDQRFEIGTSRTQIPSGGVTNITTAKTGTGQSYLPQDLLSAAKNNVIGYWHVKKFGTNKYSEWKQYYGLYTVPAGQNTTEFAYESKSGDPNSGNYLDGATFKSPGFLSVYKYFRNPDGSDAKYVKPDDDVKVEIFVTNLGSVSVDNIEIKDQLYPFNEYIEYNDDPTDVYRGVKAYRVTGTGDELIGLGSVNITDIPGDNTLAVDPGDNTLTITLPAGTTLKTNETIKLTFDIHIRPDTASTPDNPTLMYFFRNQAVVNYREADSELVAYSGIVKTNASGDEPAKAFIDPVKLTKTVETVGAPSPDPLIDGPFVVRLKVENTPTDPIKTTGYITDVIPEGFVITANDLPPGSIMSNYQGEMTVIEIKDVDLSDTREEIEYYYTLEYSGNNYGVTYTSTSAEYIYIYKKDEDSEPVNVLLDFPKTPVGIRVKTRDDVFSVSAGQTGQLFKVTDNDDFKALQKMTDGNYDIVPEIVLYDSGMNQASKNGTDDYEINGLAASYKATLLRSSEELRFDATGVGGVVELYYKIKITATKKGATPETFDLTSDFTKVTINVTPNS